MKNPLSSKIIGVMLAVLMLLSVLPLAGIAYAVETEESGGIDLPIIDFEDEKTTDEETTVGEETTSAEEKSDEEPGVEITYDEYSAAWDESLFCVDPTVEEYPGSDEWKRLAKTAGVLSGLAYGSSEQPLSDAFASVGLTDSKFSGELTEFLQPGYAFAHKTIDCGGVQKELVTAVFRGTQSITGAADAAADLLHALGEIDAAAGNAYTALNNYLNENAINKNDAVFFVTGYSLGGALANGIAESLSADVEASHVFGFTFASPKTNTAAEALPHRNVSNFVSASDTLTYLGLTGLFSFRYGETCYVKTPFSAPFKESHALTAYLKGIDEMSETDKAPEWYETLMIQGAVDAEIYDDAGTPVGKIANNAVKENTLVPAFADGDNKYFFLPEGEYTVRFTGTGSGTMTYTVLKADAVTEEIVGSKQWSRVALNNGKVMLGNILPELQNTKLLLMDSDGVAGEIANDGKEAVYLKSISLDKTSVTLRKSRTLKLTVTYNPTNTTADKTVLWSTSNSKVATVENGTVTARGAGTAVITAMVGGKTAVCQIKVPTGENGSPNTGDTDLTLYCLLACGAAMAAMLLLKKRGKTCA